jgi:hypothetical protein
VGAVFSGSYKESPGTQGCGKKWGEIYLFPGYSLVSWNLLNVIEPRIPTMTVGQLHTNQAARMASRAENEISEPDQGRNLIPNVRVSERPNRPGEEFRAVSALALQARETTPNPLLLSSILVSLQ